ncbi:hypothetical protein H4R99_007693 [Coemansia sp. RSA 1722]|nr:hypothetical protein IWW45_008425 [Coemansia sp. RSA 485]KAJ2588748.1 hypothetical protein H4R99_007693 [Coemansia sp. RSA 1722]
MFSVSKQLLRPRYAALRICRSFASQPIYVGNLAEETTAETLRSKFEEFGTIAGVRMNAGTRGYKYAHIYFMAGKPPMINGQFQPMIQMNPTMEETDAVMEAVNKSIKALDSTELDGNTIYVKSPVNKPIKHKRKDDNSGENPNIIREQSYKTGFADGYSRGYADAVAGKL